MSPDRIDQPKNSLEQLIGKKGLCILSAILLVHFAILTTYSLHKIKQWVSDDLEMLTRVINQHASESTARGKSSEAKSILNSLQSQPAVQQAVIFTNNGQLLARYDMPFAEKFCPHITTPKEIGLYLEPCGITQFAPIHHEGAVVGEIGIQVDIRYHHINVLTIAVADLGLSAALILVSKILWRRLAKDLTLPLGQLILATRRTMDDGAPQVNVSSNASLEIINLCESFNRMMILLQERDRSLREEITHRKSAERRLSELAYLDSVTNLHNRHYFAQAIHKSIVLANHEKSICALLYIDLDGFKSVNDNLGHDAGDLLLQEVGNRLRGHVRDKDVVCRIGGDEFAVVIYPLASPETAGNIADKLVRRLAIPYQLKNHSIRTVSASIGVALFPSDGADIASLMAAADSALYQAKASGKCCYKTAERKCN